jgi:hypothetical protein
MIRLTFSEMRTALNMAGYEQTVGIEVKGGDLRVFERGKAKLYILNFMNQYPILLGEATVPRATRARKEKDRA